MGATGCFCRFAARYFLALALPLPSACKTPPLDEFEACVCFTYTVVWDSIKAGCLVAVPVLCCSGAGVLCYEGSPPAG